MKREICCPKCAEHWRQTTTWATGKYPNFNDYNEGMRQVAGKAAFDMTCDGCGDELEQNSPATAVSIYSKTTPYFEWEAGYIDAEGAAA